VVLIGRRGWSLLGLAIALACDGGTIIDDWGPPAGFTTIVGTVRRADNTPASAINLSFTDCTLPVGGFLAFTTTDGQGRYRLEGTLAPGLRVDADTVRVKCEVRAGPPPLVLDTVDVRFWRQQSAVVPTVVDLRFPS
jgi:hypothetical protein